MVAVPFLVVCGAVGGVHAMSAQSSLVYVVSNSQNGGSLYDKSVPTLRPNRVPTRERPYTGHTMQL